MSVITDACDRCGGSGEFYEIEHDEHGSDVVKTGERMWELVAEGEWRLKGTRECTKCNGWGRLNPGESS